jgi:hypothetical protein
MKTVLAGVAVLLLAWAPVHAAEPVAEMFAYGSKLEATGQQAFYQLELPLEVYQTVTRRDLGDLRVFNAAGQMVPHALRHPENSTVRKDVVTAELPFFPIRSADESIDGDLSIHVERNPQGTIIDVRAAKQQESAATGPIRAYLIDAGSLKRPIDALDLAWAEGTADFLGELRVETSDDLHAWRPLITGTVARLSYQGYQLDRSSIELPRSNARYLRIAWPDNRAPAELSNIIALAHQSTTTNQPQRRWLKLKALPVAGQPQTYLADLEGFLPVDTIRIQLAGINSLAAVRLAAADSATAQQREHWRGLAYNLQADGKTVTNPAITVTPTTSRYWTLTIDNSETALRSAPQLEFGWQPARLVFLAQGDGPYLLAYGSREIESANFSVEALLQKTGSNLHPASIEPGPQFPIGGKDKLLPTAPPFPWKTWLLWSVLVTGVLLIGWMSVRLYQQLHAHEKNQD